MKDICHPNIIRFHDSFEHDNRFLVIIMEYCEIGNLKHYIRNSEKIPERECLEIAEQICSALKVCFTTFYNTDYHYQHW